MSLPSCVIFYNKGEEVGKSFVNCGWFYDHTIESVKELLMELEYPDGDWDILFMYNYKYTYEQVIEMVMNEV